MPVPMEVHVIPVKGKQRHTLVYVVDRQADVIDGWDPAQVNKAVEGIIAFCFRKGFKTGPGKSVKASSVELTFFSTDGKPCGASTTFGYRPGHEDQVVSNCPSNWGEALVPVVNPPAAKPAPAAAAKPAAAAASKPAPAAAPVAAATSGRKGPSPEAQAKAAVTRAKNKKKAEKQAAQLVAIKSPEGQAARQRGRDKAKAAKAKAAAETSTKRAAANPAKAAVITASNLLDGILPKAPGSAKAKGSAAAAKGKRAPNAWNAFSSAYRASHPGAEMDAIKKAYKKQQSA